MTTKNTKNFDAVAFSRRVREANYRKYGHLPFEEFAATLAKRGEQSALWQRLEETSSSLEDKRRS